MHNNETKKESTWPELETHTCQDVLVIVLHFAALLIGYITLDSIVARSLDYLWALLRLES